MVTTTVAAYLRGGGFPRASGDGPIGWNLQRLTPEFPPRERGWSLDAGCHLLDVIVSPARAGMVPGVCIGNSSVGGFPRASGDGFEKMPKTFSGSGFPPRERGWSPLPEQSPTPPTVSPARAGMVPHQIEE